MRTSQSLRGWITQKASAYKDREKFTADAMAACGLSRKSVTDTLSKLQREGKVPSDVFEGAGVEGDATPKRERKVTRAASGGKRPFRMSVDISAVTEEWDDEGKIERAIQQLDAHIIKDNDFRVELEIRVDRWKVVSGLEKFSKNKIELKGKQYRGVYWGQEQVVNKLRRKIDMV